MGQTGPVGAFASRSRCSFPQAQLAWGSPTGRRTRLPNHPRPETTMKTARPRLLSILGLALVAMLASNASAQVVASHGSYDRGGYAPRYSRGSYASIHVWVPGRYETVQERYWVPGWTERVWVEP